MSRADTTKVKAFASRSFDKARPAYGRFTETWPRQCIFVGTTNDDQYLRDMTGNRRFWPVRTAVIDLEALRRDRDQLWAEAAAREALGESIFLHKSLWPDAQAMQDSRLEEDPWIDALTNVPSERKDDYDRIPSAALLDRLQLEPKQTQNYHAKRLAMVMRKLGWDGPKHLKIKGQLVRGYERPIIPTDEKPPVRRGRRKAPSF